MTVIEKTSDPTRVHSPRYGSVAWGLPVFFIGALLTTGQMYTPIPLFTTLQERWDAGPAAMAWILSAFAFGYAVGMLLSGPGANRYGFRTLSSVGMVVAGVVTLLIGFAPSYASVLVLRIIQGLVVGTFSPSVMTYIGRAFPPRHRPLGTSTVTTGFFATVVLSQMASQYLVHHWGPLSVWIVSAAGFFALALALRAVMVPDDPQPGASLWKSVAELSQVFRHARLIPLFALVAFAMAAGVAVFAGIEATGAVTDPGELLTLRSVALPFLVAVPFIVLALKRFSLASQMVGSLAVGAAALAVIGLTDPDPLVIGLAVAVYIACTGISTPAVLQTAMRIAPEFGASASSALMFSNYVGATLGPILVTALYGFGLSGIAWVLVGLVALAIAFAAWHLTTSRAEAAPA
ncbi:MFS transporter [Salininema proteolyticum]|uniref:MFS transporter n=1 Tax=Salininema proteolyticum TaxID=1607685 RepID=A0ABV8TVP7_9ACTN